MAEKKDNATGLFTGSLKLVGTGIKYLASITAPTPSSNFNSNNSYCSSNQECYTILKSTLVHMNSAHGVSIDLLCPLKSTFVHINSTHEAGVIFQSFNTASLIFCYIVRKASFNSGCTIWLISFSCLSNMALMSSGNFHLNMSLIF